MYCICEKLFANQQTAFVILHNSSSSITCLQFCLTVEYRMPVCLWQIVWWPTQFPLFNEVYPFIYMRACHELCFDLPAPSPPGCDRPRPAHKHCPRAGGQHRTTAPEHDGTRVNHLRKRDEDKTAQKQGEIFLKRSNM